MGTRRSVYCAVRTESLNTVCGSEGLATTQWMRGFQSRSASQAVFFFYFVGVCVLFVECLLLVPPISYCAALSLPCSIVIVTFVKLSVDRQFVHLMMVDFEIALSIVACLERLQGC